MNGLTVEVGDRKDPLTIPLLLEIVKDPFKGYFGSLVSEDEWVSEAMAKVALMRWHDHCGLMSLITRSDAFGKIDDL